MKKLLSIILCMAMLCTLLAACGATAEEAPEIQAPAAQAPEASPAEESGKTKITVLRPGDEAKVAAFMEPAVQAFEAANPDIDVEIMYESWAGWIQTYPTYFEADTQPDVIFWWDNKLFDSSAHSHLVDLSPYLSQEMVDRIPKGVWDLVDSGMDGLYYVPSSVDSFVMYYNRDVFEAAGLDPDAPPTTWEELLNAAKTITEKTGLPGIGIPAITGSEVLQEFVGHFITQNTNENIMDADSMPLFNTEAGLEAVQLIEDLVPYFQTSPTEYGRGELRALLRDGKVGMIFDGPWAVPGFVEAYGAELDPIGVAYVPVGPSGEKICWAGTNGWIASRASTAEASAKFIEYLMSPEVLEAHHIAYGSAPLYEVEFENETFQHDYWDIFYNTANEWSLFGMIGRNSPTPAAYYTAIEEVWQQLILGQLDAETAIAAAAEAVEGVTARNQ